MAYYLVLVLTSATLLSGIFFEIFFKKQFYNSSLFLKIGTYLVVAILASYIIFRIDMWFRPRKYGSGMIDEEFRKTREQYEKTGDKSLLVKFLSKSAVYQAYKIKKSGSVDLNLNVKEANHGTPDLPSEKFKIVFISIFTIIMASIILFNLIKEFI